MSVAWSRVDALIATRKLAEYDAAVTLLTDLQALAEREDRYDTFTLRTIELRHTHLAHDKPHRETHQAEDGVAGHDDLVQLDIDLGLVSGRVGGRRSTVLGSDMPRVLVTAASLDRA